MAELIIHNHIIPEIDYKYWYEKNIKDSYSEQRFIAMITNIVNIYNGNNNYCQAYFCDNINEINRLKSLNYNELECEILQLIRNNNFSDEEILKVYDLIQVWGGLQGGSNPYKLLNDTSTRLNYHTWINNYKELIHLSIERKISVYQNILDKKIPCLNMSFGSKHISFWSRRETNDNSFMIIDNKISGVFGYKEAKYANYKVIIANVHEAANKHSLKPYQIEKGLFTFHKFYFDNKNSKFNNVIQSSTDYDIAYNLKEVLKIGLINKTDKINPKNKFSILKNDYFKIRNDVYISGEYVTKTIKIKASINKLSTITKENRMFYKYIGDLEGLIMN